MSRSFHESHGFIVDRFYSGSILLGLLSPLMLFFCMLYVCVTKCSIQRWPWVAICFFSNTLWLFNVAMENHHAIIGKPSISMGHLYHGYVKCPQGNLCRSDDSNITSAMTSKKLDAKAHASRGQICDGVCCWFLTPMVPSPRCGPTLLVYKNLQNWVVFRVNVGKY